jgi:hypothetical protein
LYKREINVIRVFPRCGAYMILENEFPRTCEVYKKVFITLVLVSWRGVSTLTILDKPKNIFSKMTHLAQYLPASERPGLQGFHHEIQ